MFSEDPILLPEIVDQIVLVTVHPASEREDEELQRRRHSLRRLGRLDQHRPSLGRFFAPYGVAIVSMPADGYAASGEALLELLSSTFSPEDLESITNRDDVAVITYGFSARDREKAVRLQWKVQEISRSARTSVYMGAALP